MAFESPDDAHFDSHARNPWLTASNGEDGVPSDGKTYPNGFAFPQMKKRSRYGPDHGECWGDCNGSGSEKLDYFEFADKDEDTTADFYDHLASSGWDKNTMRMPAGHSNQGEPSGVIYPNGFAGFHQVRHNAY